MKLFMNKGYWSNAILVGAVTAVSLLAATGLRAADADSTRKIKIVLIGDSTMTDNAGWGLGFKQLLDPAKVELVNASRGGRSSLSFMTEGR